MLALAMAFERAGTRAVGLADIGVGSAAHLVPHAAGTDLGGPPETDVLFFAVMTAPLLIAGLLHWW